MSKNTNCLADMKCPKCGSLEPFLITATSVFRMYDDGTESHGDVEFDDYSNCSCKACGYGASVGHFRAAPQDAETTLGGIRDLLFLDMDGNGEFYNPDKEVDSDITGEVINKVLEHYPDMFIKCSLCGGLCDAQKAHLHQDEYIGACCWDDRLKASE